MYLIVTGNIWHYPLTGGKQAVTQGGSFGKLVGRTPQGLLIAIRYQVEFWPGLATALGFPVALERQAELVLLRTDHQQSPRVPELRRLCRGRMVL